MPYQVTYAIDSLDPKPTVETFDTESEAIDWLCDEVARRVDHIVQHSPYMIDESDVEAIVEAEHSLARIERL